MTQKYQHVVFNQAHTDEYAKLKETGLISETFPQFVKNAVNAKMLQLKNKKQEIEKKEVNVDEPRINEQ